MTAFVGGDRGVIRNLISAFYVPDNPLVTCIDPVRDDLTWSFIDLFIVCRLPLTNLLIRQITYKPDSNRRRRFYLRYKVPVATKKIFLIINRIQ